MLADRASPRSALLVCVPDNDIVWALLSCPLCGIEFSEPHHHQGFHSAGPSQFARDNHPAWNDARATTEDNHPRHVPQRNYVWVSYVKCSQSSAAMRAAWSLDAEVATGDYRGNLQS